MSSGAWRIVWAAPGADDALAPALAALAKGATPDSAEPIKENPVRSVLRVPLDSGGNVYLKCEFGGSRTRRWRARMGQSATAQEARNLRRLHTLGVAAVEPLLCAERWTRDGRHLGVLATRELVDAIVLRTALAEATPTARRQRLFALTALARRLHDAGLWHRDLHAGNALFVPAEDRVALVDVQKLRRWPGPLPTALRARDLGLLVDDLATTAHPVSAEEVVEGYLCDATRPLDTGALISRIRDAAARRRQARLRSRGARCLRPSSGFRVETHGPYRLFRRADMPAESVLAALGKHLRDRPDGCGRTRHAGLHGGPVPGPPPHLSLRGHGQPEAGAPAKGDVVVQSFPFRAGEQVLAPLRRCSAARTAWRSAHALLLRRIDTPAPLALVEPVGWAPAKRAWYLFRDEPDAVAWAPDAAERGALVERLLAVGARHAGGTLRLGRRGDREDSLLVETPAAVRFVFGRGPRPDDAAALRDAIG